MIDEEKLMNLNITQQNLHLLLPGKVTALAQFYAEDHHCTMLQAIRHIYSTPLYKQLSDESTSTGSAQARTLAPWRCNAVWDDVIAVLNRN